MNRKNKFWDITNRPSTKTKLQILRKCFDVWITIWNKQNWIDNELYVIDLFAGRGKYLDNQKEVSGSPLIFLEVIFNKIEKLKTKNHKIKIFLVEKAKINFKELKNNLEDFISKNRELKEIVSVIYFNSDCNEAIENIIKDLKNTTKAPCFIFIDPTGLQIKKETLEKIVELKNPKDILLNYILEGVRRTSGVLKKKVNSEKNLTIRDLKTVETLKEFIGDDENLINLNDREMLGYYVKIFTSNGLKVVGYDMKYSDRNDILYYLLFASRKLSITNIVKDIFSKQKEEMLGTTLFGGKEFYKKEIFSVSFNEFSIIERKSLLYKTEVEYGDWTINHIIGCKHGCKFPCYAMMMAKKFGWVKNYEDWRRPRITKNYFDILEKEIPKYKNQIDFVHLCFMTDPFMYDIERGTLIEPIKETTLNIIERLNKDGIKVTTLTKGIYPEDLLDYKRFSRKNEHGITLVSLNEDFKKEFEPFSSPYKDRIASLKKLADNGLNTWVSMEPYPTPDLDKTAENIEETLEQISFVKKIIFGKLNYRRLFENTTMYNMKWRNNVEFYEEMVKKLIDFCKKRNIVYHIKLGTPMSMKNTINIFKEQKDVRK
ncbi:MAG: three-Cys-motif partner protein TcmP [Endomicrobia bacterium]|nr:three-Cys-motif partner protein TcmP [Endomicrobiia bacterium]